LASLPELKRLARFIKKRRANPKKETIEKPKAVF
jgi:hypothetical protein